MIDITNDTFTINYSKNDKFFKKNFLLNKFLSMDPITKDMLIIFDNISKEPEFYYIDYFCTLCHSDFLYNIHDYAKYVSSVVSSIFSVCKYDATDEEILLAIYTIILKTYSDKCNFTVIDEFPIDNNKINIFLSMSTNSNFHVYCLYTVLRSIANKMLEEKDRDNSLLIRILDKIFYIRDRYESLETTAYHLVEMEANNNAKKES